MTSGAAATTSGSVRMISRGLLPVVDAQAGAVGQDAKVRVGDEDPLAQVVAKAVHDAEHHDERRDADHDAASGDHGVEREEAPLAARWR